MFKRAIRALFLLPALIAGLGAANAAGTIAYSLSQQLDQYGVPLSGCLLYIVQAGTTSTPQNAYKDSSLTQPHPNPIVCDAAGRLPQFFLADGLIKIRLTDKVGVTQVVADNVLVIGPSSGGGGGGSIDATTIAATGDLKWSYGTGTLTGWVRCNGGSVGSASSGATERANADAQALFQTLWSRDPNLAVSGGRGAAALADWSANKTIALPDCRGRVVAGLDDMGAPSAARLNTVISSTTLGAAGGAQTHALSIGELASHTHTGVTGIESATHAHNYTAPNAYNDAAITAVSGGTSTAKFWTSTSVNTTNAENANHYHSFTTDAAGSGAAHSVTQPTILTSIYIKL